MLPLRSQSPAERHLLDSLLIDLARATSVAGVPAASRCQGQSASTLRLCEGLLTARRADFNKEKKVLAKARDLLERVVEEEAPWPYAWYALGVLRLDAVSVGLFAREGPLQPLGVSNQSGAAYALIRALELDSTFARAAEALATAPMPPAQEGTARLAERMAMLRRVRGSLSAAALFGAAQVELDAGSADSAIALAELALDRNDPGVPRGAILLTESRALYKVGATVAGRSAFLNGAADSSATSRALYREQVAWIATAEELKAWDSLPPPARPDWLAHFWGRRDVADGRPEGARLAEHVRRLNYAMANYRIFAPPSGRHMISQNISDLFSDLMHPASEESVVSGAQGSVASTPLAGTTTFPDYGGAFGAQMADGMLGASLGTASPLRTVPLFQQFLDDRGLVYVRHGAPDKVARNFGSEAPTGNWRGIDTTRAATMIWRYDLPDGPLVLQFIEEDFDGTTEPNMLVPSLAFGHGRDLAQMCWIDPSICPKVSPRLGLMGNARERGLEQVKRAITTDEFVRPFAAPIHPSLQVYGLQRQPDGGPRLVVPFAVPGGELKPSTSASGRVVYPLHLQLMAVRQSDGRRFELDTLREFLAPRELRKEDYLNGVLELPVATGTYTVSMVFAQGEHPNAIAHLDDATVALGGTRLKVSDLVIGKAGSGVAWQSGTTRVSLNPLNLFQREGEAEVYFQLDGLTAGASYQISFDFFRSDDKPTRAPRLSLSFSQQANEKRLEISRGLGLKNLDPAKYRVKLTVRGEGQEASTVGWLTIR